MSALLVACPARVCGQSASAEQAPPASPTEDPGPWVPSFRSMGQDAVDIATAPLSLSSAQQWVALGAAGLVTTTALTLDEPTYQRMTGASSSLSHTTKPLAGPGRWYDRVGPDQAALGTAGVLAASGLLLQRRDFTRTSVRVVEALVYTKAVTSFAKGAFSRSRPFTNSGSLTADPGAFTSEHNKLSMPSGHTARAFAVASVLSHEFDRWYVSVPSYGMAGSVAAERIRSGDHWLSDVMVGGALGYFIGRAVSPSPSEKNDESISYEPVLGTDRVGVSVEF